MPAYDPAVTVQSYRLPDNRAVLDFDTPVLFQTKEIGRIHLGLFEAPLTKVANLMLVLLTILTLVTSAAVAGGWGSVPDRSRTCNLRLRRPTLYPIELRGRVSTKTFVA